MAVDDEDRGAACYAPPFGARVKVRICRTCEDRHATAVDCEPRTLHPADQAEADAREEFA